MDAPQLLCIGLIFPEWTDALPHVCKTVNDFLMPETIEVAVYNDWQLVVRVHGETQRWTEKAMDGAAERGRLDIVEWLHDTRSEGCTIAAIDGAVVNGHLDVVMWLEANYGFGRCSADAVDMAIVSGHFDVVEWLLCRDWTEEDWEDELVGAAEEGNVPILPLMLNRDAPQELPFGFGLRTAAEAGQTEVVELLRDHCEHYDIIRAANNAAANEHIDIVKLLLQTSPRQLANLSVTVEDHS